MPTAHLTDIVVQRLKQPGTYFDEALPGFGVRVGKNRKTWIVMRGQVRQRVRVGHYPAMSLADARKEARKLLIEQPTRNPGIRFGEAYVQYKDALSTRKPRTQAEYKRLMGKYFEPKLGKKRLAELTYEEIMECVAGASPSEAAHALVVCRAFLRWCLRPPRRYITHSPLEGVQVKPGKARKRVLKDPELVTVWHAAEKQGYPHGTIVQLLILTGQRRGEIAALRWPWINTRDQTITLPPEITKNGLEHTFPYNGRVSRILETIPRLNSTDLLFPSRVSDERPISGWSKFKKEMEDGIAGWTLHDLRRTFGTGLAEIRVPPHIVERLLNHKMGAIGNKADSIVSAVAQVYNLATYLPEMREAIEKWEAKLDWLLAR